MAKSEVAQNSRPVSMVEALNRKYGNQKHDEVPIPGKDGAKVNVLRGTELPRPRKLAGFLANAAAYFGVEAYKARFNEPQERRRIALINFAQQHEGVRGIAARMFRLSVHPETVINYDEAGLQSVLKDKRDRAVSTTWTASVPIPANHETALGVPLTAEFLNTAFKAGVLALAGLAEEQAKLGTTSKVDGKVIYGMVQSGEIAEEDVELMGTAEETWTVRPTTPLAGAAAAEIGITVGDAEPVPLRP